MTMWDESHADAAGDVGGRENGVLVLRTAILRTFAVGMPHAIASFLAVLGHGRRATTQVRRALLDQCHCDGIVMACEQPWTLPDGW